MDAKAIREQLAARLDTIAGLQVWAYPPDGVTAPAVIVTPMRGNYDLATDGSAEGTWGLWLAAGRPGDQSAHELLDALISTTGAQSVKAVLESGTYTAMDYVRVVDWDEEVDFTSGGVTYLAALLTLDITQ